MKAGSSHREAGSKAAQRAPIALAGLATGVLIIGILLVSPRPSASLSERTGIAPIGTARQAVPSPRGDVGP